MRLTKQEFELSKELIESEIRGNQLKVLELKKDISENQIKAVEWDKEKSLEDVRKSRLGYESTKVNNDILEQKKQQLTDSLEFEKEMTKISKETLLTQGKSALLSLQQAQIDLENNHELFELKYDRRLAYETLKL